MSIKCTMIFLIFMFIYLLILAVPGLSWDMRDLRCYIQNLKCGRWDLVP